MSQPQGPAKICSVCHEDCSRKPREKDAQGRYTCGPCAEKLRAKAAARPTATPAPPPPPAAAAPPDDGPLLLEGLDAASMADLLRAEAGAAPVAPVALPDVAAAPGQDSGPSRKCPKCGYDLRGLKGKVCPECGAVARFKSPRAHAREAMEEEAIRTVRMAYIRPLVVTALGLAGLFAIRMMQGHLDYFTSDLIWLAVRIPVGMGVYFACCLTFLGFNSPIHLIALQLLGVYAALSALSLVVFALPLGLYGLIGVYLIHVMLLMSELDLDRSDAALMAVLTTIAMVGVTILVIYYRLLGLT